MQKREGLCIYSYLSLLMEIEDNHKKRFLIHGILSRGVCLDHCANKHYTVN